MGVAQEIGVSAVKHFVFSTLYVRRVVYVLEVPIACIIYLRMCTKAHLSVFRVPLPFDFPTVDDT